MKARALLSTSLLSTALLLAALTACERPAPAEDTSAPTTAAQNAKPEATPTPAPAPQGDPTAAAAAFVLPGDFAPDIGIEELRKRYGAANVRSDNVPGAEGEEYPGVILFPDDPTRRAYLYFQDGPARKGLSMVRVLDRESKWTLDNGLRMGLPLNDVVELNAKPISFSGFEWDYGGTILDYHGGKLDPEKQGAIRRNAQLGLREAQDGPRPDATPIGEGTYSSNDPRYPEQDRWIVVAELTVSLPGEDDL